MKMRSLSPMLYTNDISSTLAFYRMELGFTCHSIDTEEGWMSLRRDGVHLMFSVPNNHLPFEKAAFTGSFYFYVEAVDDWWESFRENEKVQMAYPIETFGYGMREFAIYDNNGYMLQFGEEVGEKGSSLHS